MIQYLNYGLVRWLPRRIAGCKGAVFRYSPKLTDPPDGFAVLFLFTAFGFGICIYDVGATIGSSWLPLILMPTNFGCCPPYHIRHYLKRLKVDGGFKGWAVGCLKFIPCRPEVLKEFPEDSFK